MPGNYDRDLGFLTQLHNSGEPEEGPWEVIVKYEGDLRSLEAELGLELELLGAGYAVLTLERELIPLLYNYPQIEYVELPKLLSFSLRQSAAAACISPGRDFGGYGLRGQGVLIGIIDSGIDYTHADFRNPDGSSRVLYLWDQTLEGQPPRGFKEGSEYDNAQLNRALAASNPFELLPSRDTLGHGTAVAGIAAGNGRSSDGLELGIAPEAGLLIVKLGYRGYASFTRTTEVMRGVKYVHDKARELGRPLVLNLSFGTNEGGHDGSSLFETYLDAMSAVGKTVTVVAAGNEGAAGHHFAGQVAAGESVAVDFSVTADLGSLYLTMWQDFADTFRLELIAPNGRSMGEISFEQRFISRDLGGAVLSMYYGQPTHYNGAQEAFFLFRARQSGIPQGLWRLIVRGVEVVEGRFHIWLPTLEEVGRGAQFSRAQPYTTLTLPATAEQVLSVGGYDSLLGAAAYFSGRGYSRKLALKPDIVAPAVGIIAPRAGGGYDSYTGTSMAAPFGSGAAALLMEWGIVQGRDPFLYGQRVKAFLQKGARRWPAVNYPNQQWGYGLLCLEESLRLLWG